MKMKEICEKTGLTERAVRLYCERGLLAPQTYTQNEREYLVFSERDEQALRCIATLREADFSLEAIRTMQNEPDLIEQTVRTHTMQVMKESVEKQHLCQKLQTIDPKKFHNIVELADELRRDDSFSHISPLKGPTFAEFCEQGGNCEDERLFAEEDRLVRRGRIFTGIYVTLRVIMILISSSISAGAFIDVVVPMGFYILLFVFFIKGHTWARVVLALLQGIGLLMDLRWMNIIGFGDSIGGYWVLALCVVLILAEIVAFYFLAFDKGVSAYQHEKRTGDQYL